MNRTFEEALTQGSSCLATLGFVTQSLWDWIGNGRVLNASVLPAGFLALLLASHPVRAADAPKLQGELSIHDPSTILKSDNNWWVFGTGLGVIARHSRDLVNWETGPPVFTNPPTWITNVSANHRGRFWAPDVVQLKDRYLLYYSISSWGVRESAIALVTNATLNPLAANYRWHDAGIVIQTTSSNNFNAIDPSVMLDTDGRLWLAFGSYWSGIKLIELDPATGLRVATNSPLHSLAWHESIEAACLYRRGEQYYLFVNWGQCCRGTNSTYEIRIGRSVSITGPYLDKAGKDLLSGGGTVFLKTWGDHIGPGHAGIVQRDGKDWLSYHYYDARNRGRPMLDILELRWTADGWPEVQPRPAPESPPTTAPEQAAPK